MKHLLLICSISAGVFAAGSLDPNTAEACGPYGEMRLSAEDLARNHALALLQRAYPNRVVVEVSTERFTEGREALFRIRHQNRNGRALRDSFVRLRPRAATGIEVSAP
ncbi:MAG: hypothetical protein AAGF12_39120, partial [Myxococcota bacterium]